MCDIVRVGVAVRVRVAVRFWSRIKNRLEVKIERRERVHIESFAAC